MLPERDAAEAARELARLLEKNGYSYAIGGALALAVAGVPRGTIDVDLNVFVRGSTSGLSSMFRRLSLERTGMECS